MKIIIHQGGSTRVIDADPAEYDLRNPKTPEEVKEAHRRGLLSDRKRNELMEKLTGMRAAPRDHRDCDCSDCRDKARDGGNVVKRIGKYEIIEGTGTEGGDWFAKGRGERKRFKTRREAEEHADMSREDLHGDAKVIRVGDRKIIIHRGHDAITWGFPKWMQYVEFELMRIYGIDPADTNFDYRAAHARGDEVRTVVDLVGTRYTRDARDAELRVGATVELQGAEWRGARGIVESITGDGGGLYVKITVAKGELSIGDHISTFRSEVKVVG